MGHRSGGGQTPWRGLAGDLDIHKMKISCIFWDRTHSSPAREQRGPLGLWLKNSGAWNVPAQAGPCLPHPALESV